jgi:hypothetical protein
MSKNFQDGAVSLAKRFGGVRPFQESEHLIHRQIRRNIFSSFGDEISAEGF